MTWKHTPPMDHLDAFLDSAASDDGGTQPYRSVDEILRLNDSDSDPDDDAVSVSIPSASSLHESKSSSQTNESKSSQVGEEFLLSSDRFLSSSSSRKPSDEMRFGAVSRKEYEESSSDSQSVSRTNAGLLSIGTELKFSQPKSGEELSVSSVSGGDSFKFVSSSSNSSSRRPSDEAEFGSISRTQSGGELLLPGRRKDNEELKLASVSRTSSSGIFLSGDPSGRSTSGGRDDSDELKSGSVSRTRSGDFGGDLFSLGRKNYPLFGVGRSNAKPGAALAAAVAASCSIPTPHAAAIKLRRARTEELDSKASSSAELMTCESCTGSEISQLDEKLIDEDVKWDSFQSAEVENRNDVSPKEAPVDSGDGIDVDTKFLYNNLGDVGNGLIADPDVASFNTVVQDSVVEGETLHSVDSINNHDEMNGNIISESVEEEPAEEELKIESSDFVDSKNVEVQIRDNTEEYATDDVNPLTEVSHDVKDVIVSLENKKNGNKIGKKSRPSMKPLQLAEELEKKHAFAGQHWEEGVVAAQPTRLKGIQKESTVLGYFDISASNTITRTISSHAFRRDHGFPQSLAVHLNFIAVGMSRGVIAVFPSKYSPHLADIMDAKLLLLGLQGDRSYAPVTSLCFNQQGDLLFAGYGDGHYTVWEMLKFSSAKVVTEHKAPVVHMMYLGQDSQAARQFNVVSGDSKGVVKLIRFSGFSWLNRFSTKPSVLLDESTGTVVCASPLLSDECHGVPSAGASVSASGIGSMMGSVVGGDWKPSEASSVAEEGVVIFVTHQSALVAKVTANTPEVYAKLTKPDGVREGALPYTAWKYVGCSSGSVAENASAKESEILALLAMAWDREVQVAMLVKSELKTSAKWKLDSSAVGVAWLNDQMLVVLTSVGQLCLYAKDGNLIHQTKYDLDGSRGDELIGYHTHFTNNFGNPEKAHHNFLAVRGATLYILGPMHLIITRLLPWKERIEVLRKAGEWTTALNMATTLYDGQAHGVFDLPSNLDDVQKTIMPYLIDLLLAYVDEVFSYISVAFSNQLGKLEELDDRKLGGKSVLMEIKEQFTHVGGIAVEFCVHIKRSDILFEEILSRFVSVQQKETFLELLEPYILKDMLGSLPPEVMQSLVEHYSERGWLQRVEQCVLHMDISSLDFNQVVRLCREHRLYGALIYLFNRGLDDFRAPLEELLIVLRSSQSENAAAFGYRMLVYLKYCFSGDAFPPGHGTLPPARLPSLRMELVQFLLENSNSSSSQDGTSLLSTAPYKNLYHLLELDTEATLNVLKLAFPEENRKLDHSLPDSTTVIIEQRSGDRSVAESQNLLQKLVDDLSYVIETSRSTTSADFISKATWPSKDDISHLFEFIAHYVSTGKCEVSKEILNQILEHLIVEIDGPPDLLGQDTESFIRRQKKVLALLEVVPDIDLDVTYLLRLCEKANFHQVCGLIYDISHQYVAALESYMKDMGEPVHAFSFIDDMLQRLNDKERDTFKASVVSRIPELVQLNREGGFLFIYNHLNRDNQEILPELRSSRKSLFLYLKMVFEVHSTGTLNFSVFRVGDRQDMPIRKRVRNHPGRVQAYLERIYEFPKFVRDNPVHVNDEMTEEYLKLLCEYECQSVLKFLETCESYRVEHCLRLCLNHNVIDASAFLLERVGDVGGALLLTLSDLTNRFIALDAAVKSLLDDNSSDPVSIILKEEEVNGILDVVHACVGLLQRNSPRLEPDESESHWFQLLDSFCEPLMDLTSSNSSCGIPWKMSNSNRGARILRKLFSMFIKDIVEGMIGYVRLPTIMLKLLSDNGGQEFGDFKVTILGMLGTYDFERRILDTAKAVIEEDTFYTMNLLKKGASHGYGPKSFLCCICNCPVTKDSSAAGVRVFNCGHASHLQCEQQEKETSNESVSTGCPVCVPVKKGQKSESKPVISNGLVGRPSTSTKLSQRNSAPYVHENDATYNGSRQISRFEILSKLQKENRIIQIESIPQLRLAPPSIYHEKVKKGVDTVKGESSSSGVTRAKEQSRNRQIKDVKAKGSSIRFPLKSTIFGKEKTSKR